MNTISDIMFWISNGLLVPDVVLLILLFFRSLLLVGSFFGQYLSIRKTDKMLREQLETLRMTNIDDFESMILKANCRKANHWWLLTCVKYWRQKTIPLWCSVSLPILR